MWWRSRSAPISLFGKARWHYAKRYWYAPDRALDALLMGNRRYKRYRNKIVFCLEQLGFDAKKIKIEPGRAPPGSRLQRLPLLGLPGKNRDPGHRRQGRVRHHVLRLRRERQDPQDQGVLRSRIRWAGLYGAITEFLGFEMLDGEFKVMGMAPYGDASKYDFSRLASFENGELVINTDYANVIGLRRYKEKGKGFYSRPS